MHGVQCMSCSSLERHRFTWLYFERMTDLFDGQAKQMLHVAPEPCLEKALRKRLQSGYLTADLYNPHAMVKMDITDIHYPDETFDVIYCSHVLEHVPDDRIALGEMHRVLKSRGWAVLVVPITADETFEDPSITDPAERLRLFGQEDHVRRYGPDFANRLKEAGFDIKIVSPAGFPDRETNARMGIGDVEEIYLCVRRAS